MSKRFLITGANGFIGEYLAEELCKENNSVYACAQFATPILEALSPKVKLSYPDLTKEEEISQAILDAEPDVIFHLAAQSFPRVSWEKPAYTMEVNLIGSIHILEAMRKLEKTPTIIMIGSSAEYASHPNGSPIKEDGEVSPSSIYGVSKLAMEEVGRLYALRYNLPVIRVRPFFIIGPRKVNDFCSEVAKEIVLVEKGEKESIRVGNMQIVRDFVDVRDAVNAMILLSQKGVKGEVYNICSGQEYILGSVLETYKKYASVPIQEQVDPNLLRNYDELIKVGSPEKLFSLGWKIQYDIKDTLLDILNFWRNKL